MKIKKKVKNNVELFSKIYVLTVFIIELNICKKLKTLSNISHYSRYETCVTAQHVHWNVQQMIFAFTQKYINLIYVLYGYVMYNTCGMYAVRVKMKVDSRVSSTIYIHNRLHF